MQTKTLKRAIREKQRHGRLCSLFFIVFSFLAIQGTLLSAPDYAFASDTPSAKGSSGAKGSSTKLRKIHIQTIAVVAEKNSGEIDALIDTLSEYLGKSYKVQSFYSSSSPDLKQLENKFIIAVGHRSLKWLIDNKVSSPILSTFISQTAYLTLTKNSVFKQGQLSAIYSDPDPDYQMRLIKKLYNYPINVAVLLSHNSRYLRRHLKTVARKNDIDITILNVTASDNIYKVLNKISGSDVLLAIPDENIYNLNTIRTILLTTYRHNQAMIGFSQGMVNAGALASITTNLDDMVIEIRNWIRKYRKYNTLPKARYARFFNVKINQHVARSFKVENTNATALAKAVASEMITHLRTEQD